jgi:hypothetical protein
MRSTPNLDPAAEQLRPTLPVEAPSKRHFFASKNSSESTQQHSVPELMAKLSKLVKHVSGSGFVADTNSYLHEHYNDPQNTDEHELLQFLDEDDDTEESVELDEDTYNELLQECLVSGNLIGGTGVECYLNSGYAEDWDVAAATAMELSVHESTDATLCNNTNEEESNKVPSITQLIQRHGNISSAGGINFHEMNVDDEEEHVELGADEESEEKTLEIESIEEVVVQGSDESEVVLLDDDHIFYDEPEESSGSEGSSVSIELMQNELDLLQSQLTLLQYKYCEEQETVARLQMKLDAFWDPDDLSLSSQQNLTSNATVTHNHKIRLIQELYDKELNQSATEMLDLKQQLLEQKQKIEETQKYYFDRELKIKEDFKHLQTQLRDSQLQKDQLTAQVQHLKQIQADMDTRRKEEKAKRQVEVVVERKDNETLVSTEFVNKLMAHFDALETKLGMQQKLIAHQEK